MKTLIPILFISLVGLDQALSEPDGIATGSYVLTEIEIRTSGNLHPHKNSIKTYAAMISESDGKHFISLRYGGAGMIEVPLHISGDRVSFFIAPDSGSVDGRDLLATGFFGSRNADHFTGWATHGSNRAAFKLEPFEAIPPKPAANKAE
ncbi:MAG: hypothetical protein WD342_05025 [Verrucomicrobiales bacterium]